MQRAASLAAVLVLSTGLAYGATGKPDYGSYVGSDTLNPAPKLPTTGPSSFLALPDVTGATYSTVTMNLPGDGDDASYGIDLTGASLYDNLLTNCAVNDNGYITCNGATTIIDNQKLPDARFGASVVIAPYFDDLTPIAGMSKIELWTQPGVFAIVQWTDFALYGNPSARLTFRAIFQLGDPSNEGSVIFQYLKMMGADGSSATIGIQRAGATTWNQYSFNTAGAITTGTAGAGAALQAIAFGYDQDGDRLSSVFESAIGTDPTLHDTDGAGLDDGAELAAGKDPTTAGDDGAATDTDSDGVTDANEMFYGTDKTKADTDGDSTATTSLKDGEELYGTHTDPTVADTDRDGSRDGDEIDAGTDPLDPTSTPPVSSLELDVNGSGKAFPRSALDANGMLHVVAASSNNDGIDYYMIDPTATTNAVKIPETFIKLPASGSFSVRRPVIRAYGGKVYITYELIDGSSQQGRIKFVRINPANAPQDGTGVLATQIVEVDSTYAATGGSARHHDMMVNAAGVHLAYMLYGTKSVRGNANYLGVEYVRLSLDGVAQRTVTVPVPNKSTGGMHRWSRPDLAITSDGTVNMLTLVNYKKTISAALWTTVSDPSPKTYDIPFNTPVANMGVGANGSLIYLFGSSPKTQSVTMMVLDTKRFTASPTTTDRWFASAVIDPQSLLVGGTAVPAGNKVNQASMTPLPGGTSVGYYNHKNTNDFCLQPFLNDGMPASAAVCIGGIDNRFGKGHGAPNLDLVPLSDGSVGFVTNHNGNSSIRFTKIGVSRFGFPATLPVVNTPPQITSLPPSSALHIGATYSYAAMATDAETPNTLTWSVKGPAAMTVSATGAVSWQPAKADVGTTTATLQVCDTGSPVHCVTQTLSLTVVASGAPVIVSVPPTTAPVNAPYAYQIVASDPDNDVTGYTLDVPSPAKGNLAVTSTGLLTWTPTSADLGSTIITVTATDATGLTAQQTFTILVTVPMAIDPVFTSTPATTAVVGERYTYLAVATDPGDHAATFTYSLASTASGNMTMAADGTLSWTPKSSERGTQAITVQALSSTGRMSTQSFAVTVIDNGKGGCGCHLGGSNGGGGATGAWLVVLGLLAFALRRRARSA